MILRINSTGSRPTPRSMPKTFFIRLYLTDSCHYLLPIGRFERGSWSEQNKLRKAVQQYFNEVMQTSSSNYPRQAKKLKGMDAGSLALMSSVPGSEGESGPESDAEMNRVNLARQLAPVPVPEPPAMPTTNTSLTATASLSSPVRTRLSRPVSRGVHSGLGLGLPQTNLL